MGESLSLAAWDQSGGVQCPECGGDMTLCPHLIGPWYDALYAYIQGTAWLCNPRNEALFETAVTWSHVHMFGERRTEQVLEALGYHYPRAPVPALRV